MSKKKVTLDRTAKKLIKLTLNEQTTFAEFDLNIYLLVPEKYAVNWNFRFNVQLEINNWYLFHWLYLMINF